MRKIHGVEKNQRLKCPKCDQKFDHTSILDSHLIANKEVVRVGICEICGYKACNELGLLSHKRKVHGLKRNLDPSNPDASKPRL